MNTITISGTIYSQFDQALGQVSVEAYQKQLRKEQTLGVMTTDNKGRYTIDVPLETASLRNELDLFIRVYQINSTSRKLLGESPVYYNVEENIQIDYKIGGGKYRGASEYSTVIDKIQPILDPASVERVSGNGGRKILYLFT